jgi:hypothetical protein
MSAASLYFLSLKPVGLPNPAEGKVDTLLTSVFVKPPDDEREFRKLVYNKNVKSTKFLESPKTSSAMSWLNKLTDKNYDVILVRFKELEHLKAADILLKAYKDHNYIHLYVQLIKDCQLAGETARVLDQDLSKFLEMIPTNNNIDPNKEYDQFCASTLERHRTLGAFKVLIEGVQKGVIDRLLIQKVIETLIIIGLHHELAVSSIELCIFVLPSLHFLKSIIKDEISRAIKKLDNKHNSMRTLFKLQDLSEKLVRSELLP